MYETIFRTTTKAVYIAAAATLLMFSVAMIASALYNVASAAFAAGDFQSRILHSIGLVIISIATFDVGKFLLEEEVARERELRSSVEARRSLTKFMTIIIIAISLEALVEVFETEPERTSDLIYPAALFASAVFAMLALGLLQWLSREAESIAQETPGSDPDQ